MTCCLLLEKGGWCPYGGKAYVKPISLGVAQKTWSGPSTGELGSIGLVRCRAVARSISSDDLPLASSYLAASFCCVAADNQWNAVTSEQIDTLIARVLPLGTTRVQLIAFLDARKIEHSGHDASVDSASITAIFRDVAGSTAIVGHSVQVYFEFHEGYLTSYSLKDTYTGP
jgi:hypothetical protein